MAKNERDIEALARNIRNHQMRKTLEAVRAERASQSAPPPAPATTEPGPSLRDRAANLADALIAQPLRGAAASVQETGIGVARALGERSPVGAGTSPRDMGERQRRIQAGLPEVPDPIKADNMFTRAADRMEGELRGHDEQYGPRDGLGLAGNIVGRIGGTAAQYIVGGGAIGRLRGAAPITATGLRGGAQRVARDAAHVLPLDAAISAAGPEYSTAGGVAAITEGREGMEAVHERARRISEDPAQRLATEVAVGVGGDALLRGVAGGLRSARRAMRGTPAEAAPAAARQISPATDPDASSPMRRTPAPPPVTRQVPGEAPRTAVATDALPEARESRIRDLMGRIEERRAMREAAPSIDLPGAEPPGPVRILGRSGDPIEVPSAPIRETPQQATARRALELRERTPSRIITGRSAPQAGARIIDPSAPTPSGLPVESASTVGARSTTRQTFAPPEIERALQPRRTAEDVRSAMETMAARRRQARESSARALQEYEPPPPPPTRAEVRSGLLKRLQDRRRAARAEVDHAAIEYEPPPPAAPPAPPRAEGRWSQIRNLAERRTRAREEAAQALARGREGLFSGDEGFAARGIVEGIAGAGTGALVGGVADREDPIRGALIGAGIGGGATVAGRSLGRRSARAVSEAMNNPSVQAVSRHLNLEGNPLALKGGVREAGRDLYRRIVDVATPLSRFAGMANRKGEMDAALAQFRGARGAARAHIDYDLKPIVRAVEEAGEEAVTTLLVAERALELMGRGLEKVRFSEAEAQEAIRELSAIPAVREAADQLRRYYRGLLALKLHEGVISQEAYDAAVQNHQYYVPFVREFDGVPDDAARAGPGRGSDGRTLSGGTGVRRMDSEQAGSDIANPLIIAAEDTEETFARIGKQRVTNIITNIAEANPEAAAGIVRRLGPDEADPKHGRVVQANVGGQRQRFVVEDKDIYDAWAGMDQYQQNLFTKILSVPSKSLRAGVTIMPDFAVANAMRDFTQSSVQYPFETGRALSGAGAGAAAGALADDENRGRGALAGAGLGFGMGAAAPHMARWLSAVGDIVASSSPAAQQALSAVGSDPKMYEEWLRAGGAGFGYYIRDRRTARQVIENLKRDGSIIDVIQPRNIWNALNRIGQVAEEAPRLARYKYMRESGASRPQSLLESRDISLDFTRYGADTRTLSQITAFLNPKIQGYDKLIRMVKDPKTTAAAIGMVTTPSIALWMVNKDNPEYWDRPIWERNLFWLVPKGGDEGGFWKIPKPFELGFLFASLPERALDYLHQQDPDAFRSAMADMAGTFGELPIPTAAAPIIENLADYSFFRGRPVNPIQYENVPAEMQYDDRTSSVAVGLGQATGTSPSKIDNIIRSWTGGLGGEAMNLTSRLARRTGIDQRMEPADGRRPIIGRFETQQQNVGELEISIRRQFERAESRYNAAQRILEERGEEAARAYIRKHADVIGDYHRLRDLNGNLATVRRRRREIYQSDLSGAEKKAALTRLNRAVASVLARQEEVIR